MPHVKEIETYYSSADQGDDFKGGAVLNDHQWKFILICN
jgi:hypothetical protein